MIRRFNRFAKKATTGKYFNRFANRSHKAYYDNNILGKCFGLESDAVNDAYQQCIDIISEFGEGSEQDFVNAVDFEEFVKNLGLDGGLTNALIYCLFDTVGQFIDNDKYELDMYVNSMDSHLNVIDTKSGETLTDN